MKLLKIKQTNNIKNEEVPDRMVNEKYAGEGCRETPGLQYIRQLIKDIN